MQARPLADAEKGVGAGRAWSMLAKSSAPISGRWSGVTMAGPTTAAATSAQKAAPAASLTRTG